MSLGASKRKILTCQQFAAAFYVFHVELLEKGGNGAEINGNNFLQDYRHSHLCFLTPFNKAFSYSTSLAAMRFLAF